MRTRLMTSLCTLLAFAPAAASAQPKRAMEIKNGPAAPAGEGEGEGDAADSSGDEGSSETQGAEVVDEPKGNAVKTSPNQQGRDAAPGEVHTVVKGDTLWDLSQRYLGSPWYWPKVWSYNPEINNPHWIYPGNLVRFFPGGEEVPSRVEVGEAPTEVAQGGDEEINSADMIQMEPESAVQVTSPIGYKPKQASRIIHEGFITPRELDEAGNIDSSFADTVMLSAPDTVYVKFKNKGNVKLGDRYVIFRTVKQVEHPITGDDVGYLTKFLGTVKVIKLGKGLVTAQISDTWDAIERGDMVGPFGERLIESVAARPNEREQKGYVVSALVPFLTVFGEHHTLLIDKGSADGVLPGNTFTVIRQQDKGGNFFHPHVVENDQLPVEDIALCMAVDVKEKASTCVLTRSLREVEPGDRVEMRTQSASSAPVSSR